MSLGEVIAELPELERIKSAVERVLGDALYWFPIRHHSPTAAWLVEQAVLQRRPKLLFIEAPAGLESLLPALMDPQTRPPVALYSSFRDDQHQLRPADAGEPGDEPLQLASWYPLLSYSPEYVAIQAGDRVGAQVVFIDLPQQMLAAARLQSPVDAAPDPAQAAASAAPPAEVADDTLIEHSALYQDLARVAGYRRWDEAWDSLFEHAGHELEAYRRELATFCAAARATTPARAFDDDTGPRERHMWRSIQATLTERGIDPAEAMVVCGGYHLFLDRNDSAPLPPLPAGTVHDAVVPYSYQRVSERSGYGAGNRAPRYYQRYFEALRRGAPGEALIEQMIGILHTARRKGERVATADAIAVRHHAVLLAQLRGRSGPILDDLDDALISCCVKGDPATDGAVLRRVMREAHVGSRVGKVTPKAGRLPLLRDYYAQLDALALSEKLDHEQGQVLKLDRRQPLDTRRSAFLHRLCQLQVPLAEPVKDTDRLGQSLFAERWRLRWNTQVETALIERSLDGDSIETAAATAFGRALGQAGVDASGSCRLLLAAVAMNLDQLLVQARAACARAVDEDGRFVSLADALTSLRVLERRLGEQATTADRDFLTDLIERAWDRACFAVPEIAAAPGDDHPAIIQALKSMAEVAQTRDVLDAGLFASYVQSAAALSPVAELRGAFLAVLVDIRALDVATLAAELAAYAGAGPDRQLQAGDFLHGVLSVSTTAVMLGARALVQALDAVIAAVDRDGFLAMLPRLRAAIEQLHGRHRDALAGEVARLFGLRVSDLDQPLAGSASAHALIAELDAEVAQIMADWSYT